MIDLNMLVIPGLIGLAAYFGVKFFLKKDDEVERRREAAIDLAAEFKNYGLEISADMLKKYAVGDYSGMAHIIGDAVRLMQKGKSVVIEELDVVFKRVVEKKMATAEGRAFVTLALQDAEKKLAEDE